MSLGGERGGGGGGVGEIPKGGRAGRARSLGIWPRGARSRGAKSLGHRKTTHPLVKLVKPECQESYIGETVRNDSFPATLTLQSPHDIDLQILPILSLGKYLARAEFGN